MLVIRSIHKSFLRKFFSNETCPCRTKFGKGKSRSIPNQIWFWWTLFIVDQALTYILVPSLTNLSIKESIAIWQEEFLVFLAISQFIAIMFWTPKVLTRVELYGHWRGREVAEKLKRETAAHQELNRLREAMIFGEAEGDAYWSVIQQLEPVEDSNHV